MKAPVRKLQPARNRAFSADRPGTTVTRPTSQPAFTGDPTSASDPDGHAPAGLPRPIALAVVIAYSIALASIVGGSLFQDPPVPLQPASATPLHQTESPVLSTRDENPGSSEDTSSTSNPPTSRLRGDGRHPVAPFANQRGSAAGLINSEPDASAELGATDRDHVALVREVTGKAIVFMLTRVPCPIAPPASRYAARKSLLQV